MPSSRTLPKDAMQATSNPLRSLIERGAPVVGAWISTPSPLAAELMGVLGYDLVAIDLQHSAVELAHLPGLLQAVAATPALPVVRVSGNHFAEINKVLDLGAQVVVCPLVNSVDDARRFADAVRYPPVGSRSWGPLRAALREPAYFARSGETVTALAMIETRAGLAALDDILAVPGLDGVFVGPNDLAIALGLPPGAADTEPALHAALTRIADAARHAGRLAAIWCPDEAMAARMHALGYAITFPSAELSMLRREGTRRLAAIKGEPGASPDGY